MEEADIGYYKEAETGNACHRIAWKAEEGNCSLVLRVVKVVSEFVVHRITASWDDAEEYRMARTNTDRAKTNFASEL